MDEIKKINCPYLTINLGKGSRFVAIRQDLPVSRVTTPDFWGGQAQADTYPSVVQLRRGPLKSSPQWPRQRLSKDWMIFTREINNQNDRYAVENIFNVDSGLVNSSGDLNQQIDPWEIENLPDDQMPKPEFITTSGNIHLVEEISGKAIKITTFKPDDNPPDSDWFHHDSAAPFVVHMMATHKNGNYALISSGSGFARDCYFPLMCPGDAWIHSVDEWCNNRYEFLPKLPMVVTTNENLNIRQGPSTDDLVCGSICAGKSVQIEKYFPAHDGVWALCLDGWIALQYLPTPGTNFANYYTDWVLESMPALRAQHGFGNG